VSGSAGEKTVRFASWIMQEGFTGIPNVVLLDAELSATAVRLYGLLTYYARLNEEAWPGQKLLTEQCNASERSIRAALRQLEERTLVETHRQGRAKTNAYVLLDPAEPSSDRQILPVKAKPSSDRHMLPVNGSRPANIADPTRAHVDAVEEEERLESPNGASNLREERASAGTSNQPAGPSPIERAKELYPTLSDDEKSVMWSLVAVAQARRVERPWNPEAAIALCRDEFRNRDIADTANRFRVYYSPGGLGENKPVANLVARWREFLKRAPTLDTVVAQRNANGRGRRGAGGPPPPSSREIAARLTKSGSDT
jgi:hypothetical protein